MHRTYGVGRYITGEDDFVCRSRTAIAGRTGLLRFDGRGTTAAIASATGGSEQELMIERGFIVMEADWSSPTHWGNDVAQARAATGKTYLQSAPYNAKPGKVCGYGKSMGGLLAVLYAINNPSAIRAMALVVPAVGLIDIHDNNRGPGYGPEIETAYGGAMGWSSAKASHDPVTRASEYAALQIPTQIWYSSNDPICVPEVVVPFAQAIGATTINMGAIGHASAPNTSAEVAAYLDQFK